MLREIAENRPIPDMYVERSRAVSPVAQAAQLMLDEASEIQREFESRFKNGMPEFYKILPGNIDIVLDSGTEVRKLFDVTKAAFFLGCALPELEASVVNGQFSNASYGRRFNEAAEGTNFELLNFSEDSTEVYSPEWQSEMLELIRQDSSFAGFFESGGIRLLPVVLLDSLRKNIKFGLLRNEILPVHRHIVEALSKKE